MSNNYRNSSHWCYPNNHADRYEDGGTWRWEANGSRNNAEKQEEKSWKISKEIQILDLLSLIVGIISLAVTVFIATGVIGIHQSIDEDGDSNNNTAAKKTSTSPAKQSSGSSSSANSNLPTRLESKIADWFNEQKL